MKITKILHPLLCAALVGCSPKKEAARVETGPPTIGSQAVPPVAEPDRRAPNGLAAFQWQATTPARLRAFRSLTRAYSETQALKLVEGGAVAAIPCLLLAAVDGGENRVDALVPRLENCAVYSATLARFLGGDLRELDSLRKLEPLDLSFWNIPQNRHRFARAALPVGTMLELMRESGSALNRATLAAEIQNLLEAAALPTLELFIHKAHDPQISAEFKDIIWSKLAKQNLLLRDAALASPWSDPEAWGTTLGEKERVEFSAAFTKLSRALRDPRSVDALIADLQSLPSLKDDPIKLIAALSHEALRSHQAALAEIRAKRLGWQEIHAFLKRNSARLRAAFAAIAALVEAFDPAAARTMRTLGTIAGEIHDSLAAFTTDEHDSGSFLERFAEISARLLSTAELLTANDEDMRRRLSEIRTELQALAIRLDTTAATLHEGMASLLRQPYDLSQRRCIGEESTLARAGSFANAAEARNCRSDAAMRATTLAFDPLLNGNSLAWLNRRLGLVPEASVPNVREWGIGTSDYAFLVFASFDPAEDYSSTDSIAEAGAGIKKLLARLADTERIENSWGVHRRTLARAQDELRAAVRDFSRAYLSGIDPLSFSGQLASLDPQENLVAMVTRIGRAHRDVSTTIDLLQEDGSPHVYDPVRSRPIYVRHIWRDVLVASTASTPIWGTVRQKSLVWRCPTAPTACPLDNMNPSCSQAAYLQLLASCRADSHGSLHLMQEDKVDPKPLAEKIASELRATYQRFMPRFEEFLRARPALVETLARATEESTLLTTQLELSFETTVLPSPPLADFREALRDPEAVKKILALDLDQLHAKFAAGLKTAIPASFREFRLAEAKLLAAKRFAFAHKSRP